MTVWVKMTLRLPAQVHAALTDEVKEAGTSLNQLIVDRLNASVGGVYVREDEANDGRILPRLDVIEGRLDMIEQALNLSPANEQTGILGEQARQLRDQLQAKNDADSAD
ncbi:toxin-antitoxin system HicB family antitoxin [Tsuneonella flava]|uniref:toxin-antitoxin system HicB family antitoxin n=1 Tax=Tsuneonella flava TaxID=2055955 RepID=UPI001300119F|nr:toxin-antitoxin system HicB family antitoxin [Tsuneonella flava]